VLLFFVLLLVCLINIVIIYLTYQSIYH
jgi:hypothetical protein